MQIFPAIDLKDKEAVRLEKGDMQKSTIYSNSPEKIAKEFEKLGSEWLHLVDLNGAFSGQIVNFDVIKKIRKNTNLQIQLGGGIRNEDSIKKYLDLGINRVILGSIALKKPEFVLEMADKYPIVVGIDAINSMVAVEGWAEVSQMKAVDLATYFDNSGVEAVICTDVSKDGMLSGVNVDFTLEIAMSTSMQTIASGGVKDIDDIKKLKATNKIYGAIIGKAFYENRIDLQEAFKL